MSKWTTINWERDRLKLPKAGAVYAIYGDGVLIYVGESDNVRLRICSHDIRFGYSTWIYTPWGRFQSVTIKVRRCKRFGEWAMVERRLIRRLKPSGNIKGTGRRRRFASA